MYKQILLDRVVFMDVMVVDDDPCALSLIEAILEATSHKAVLKQAGKEAVDYLSSSDKAPDIVFMDVLMPNMDGFETAKAMKASIHGTHLPVVFLTALDDVLNLSKCLAIGDDVITKPVEPEVLIAKLEAHGRFVDLYNQVKESNDELVFYHQKVAFEREIIEHVFDGLLKENIYPHDSVRYHVSPKSTFSGDLLLVEPRPMGGLYVMISDGTGHGLAPAVGSIPITWVFSHMTQQGCSVADIAKEVNKIIVSVLPDYMFVASTILELNRAGDRVVVWSGGMPAGLIVSKKGKLKKTIEPMHCPFGVLSDDKFDARVNFYDLAEDDHILLYTDGVTECLNSAGEMFGDERLYDLFKEPVSKNPVHYVDYVIGAVESFLNGKDQQDDTTLVDLKATSILECDDRTEHIGTVKTAMPWCLQIKMGPVELKANDPVPQLIAMVKASLGSHCEESAVSIVFTELYSNALEHGILKLDSVLKETDDGFLKYYQEREKRLNALTAGCVEIEVEFFTNDEGQEKLRIKVTDSGDGFDYEAIKNTQLPDSSKACGYGSSALRALCESVEYSEGGNVVTVVYPLDS